MVVRQVKRKGRRYFRKNESRKHSKNQYLGLTINEEDNLKTH